MSFNRRGGPDRRPDRPPRREGFADRPGGRGGYPPRDRPPREQGDRPHGGARGGDRPYAPRPRFDRPPDEGAMSIRLDPRRLGVLKRLAAETGTRPGDLVRQWVEERLDAERAGAAGPSLDDRLRALDERIAALEARTGPAPAADPAAEAAADPAAEEGAGPAATEEAEPAPAQPPEPAPRARRKVSAPSERVALHDEMIAVLGERGPMTAGDLARAIAERGRYAPPRSGKPLDAAMVSQRASNPTYRARFVRNEGRIGLAEPE